MHDSVRNAFLPFSSRLEDAVSWMYVDIKNLVTTGVGNLIDASQNHNVDPMAPALHLPWIKPDGKRANEAEIRAAWKAVKNAGASNWKASKQKTLTNIRLTPESVEDLVAIKLDQFEDEIKKQLPRWDSLNADSQLAVLSMAWAMGANFKFPAFWAALNEDPPDFKKAAAHAHIKDSDNPGVVPRNAANLMLLDNAAKAQASGGPIDQLMFDVQSFAGKSWDQFLEGAKSAEQIITKNPKSAIGIVLAISAIGYAAYALLTDKRI